ncbi:hypothetical protein CRUP_023941 [Coryphaenoides rupestris]|nr:hypothetical protein CRUP_023941 [Coryphaenoides rupestris]
MSSAIAPLVSYGSDSGSENESETASDHDSTDPDATAHLKPLPAAPTMTLAVLNAAPEVAVKESVETGKHLDPSLKEVTFNPTFETLFAPEFGPVNPFKSQQMAAPRNMLSGYAEPAHLNDFMFEQQRRTFSTFVKDMYDYQGRSYLHVPQDVGINLRTADVPDKCYLPKKQIHVWSGHTKGVSAIRLFPASGHLLLSASMDCKIKLWEVYNERRCIRTFIGE